MTMKHVFEFSGDQVTVIWDRRLCIHVEECIRAPGGLFEMGRKPWCDPDRVPLRDVTDIVERCPTGALSYRLNDDGEAEQAESGNEICVTVGGPLVARGELHISGASDGMPGIRFRAALCRCGQSANKPFCDNRHQAAGFSDSGAVGESGGSLDSCSGPLDITPIKDGPLLIKGNLKLRSGSGRSAWTGNSVALCRCGASNTKPFCDGQHKELGFKAD